MVDNKFYYVSYKAASGNIEEHFHFYVCAANAIEALFMLMHYELGTDKIPLPSPEEFTNQEQLECLLDEISLMDEFYDSILEGGDWIYFDARINLVTDDPLDLPKEYSFSISDRKLYYMSHIELLEYIRKNRSDDIYIVSPEIRRKAEEYINSVKNALAGKSKGNP